MTVISNEPCHKIKDLINYLRKKGVRHTFASILYESVNGISFYLLSVKYTRKLFKQIDSNSFGGAFTSFL